MPLFEGSPTLPELKDSALQLLDQIEQLEKDFQNVKDDFKSELKERRKLLNATRAKIRNWDPNQLEIPAA